MFTVTPVSTWTLTVVLYKQPILLIFRKFETLKSRNRSKAVALLSWGGKLQFPKNFIIYWALSQNYTRDYYLRYVRLSVWMDGWMAVTVSVRMKLLGSHWTDFQDIWEFFENLSKKLSFINIWQEQWYFIRITVYSLIISPPVLFTARNVSHTSCRQNQNTHFVFNNLFPKTVLFIMWKNIIEPHRAQKSIKRMCIAC